MNKFNNLYLEKFNCYVFIYVFYGLIFFCCTFECIVNAFYD